MSKLFRTLFLIYTAVISVCLIVLSPLLGISVKYNIFLAIAVLIAAILTLITGSFFILPIKKMQKTTQKITRGDFSSKMDIKSRGELSDLAEELNKVSSDLQNKIFEITRDKNELTAILSNMIEGVIVIGKDEKIILMSPPMTTMLELRSAKTIGRPYWEVIRNEEINILFKEAMSQKKPLCREIAIHFPNESFFTMQISPVLDEEGNLSDIVAVFHDVTESKKLEKMRTEFVANVSHELKTPLTSIKGFVETLMAGAYQDTKSAKRFLEIIQRHAGRLENLVNDLLSLSSIESKDAEMNFESTSIVAALDAVTLLYKPQVEKRNQKLNVEIPKDIPPVLADRQKVEEVFSNLLDNAVKFSPHGGRISIRAKEENSYVCVDIQDNGIGIAEEHLPRLFERFYRVDKSRSKELGGTGLGLAIVKHIIQAHNGKITVQSEPEKGSTFTVYLPKTVS